MFSVVSGRSRSSGWLVRWPGIFYTVFLFTDQRIFLSSCLIRRIEIGEIVWCAMMLFHAAGLPAALKAAPVYTSRLA
jgi:hypothetical protein